MKIPAPYFDIVLQQYIEDSPASEPIQLFGTLLTGFELTMSNSFIGNVLVINVIDTSWEVLGSKLLFGITDRYSEYRCTFSFGFTEPVWFIDGVPQAHKLIDLRARIYSIEPEFTNEGLKLKFTASTYDVNKFLFFKNETWLVPDTVKNYRDLFRVIITEFGINIETINSTGSISGVDAIDATEFKNDKTDTKLPVKEAGETIADYLNKMQMSYPILIDNSPVFVRVKMDTTNKFSGSYQLISTNYNSDTSKIKKVYSFNGKDSKILSFIPKIETSRYVDMINTVNFMVFNPEEKSFEKIVSLENEKLANINNNNILKISNHDNIQSARASLINKNYNMLNNIFEAELKIIADTNLMIGEIITVKVFNKSNGNYIMENNYRIKHIVHYLESGILITNMSLAIVKDKRITTFAESRRNIKADPSLLFLDYLSKSLKSLTDSFGDAIKGFLRL